MSEPKYPVLSAEQKLSLRSQQYLITKTQAQAMQALQAAEKEFGKLVTEIGKSHNVDFTTTQFNPDTLEFMDK
jgi:hypothetical protein